MLKVFLVEDEFVVREGIKNNIDWSANGYDFCGETSDGELALPMIRKLKPDIVITDIKMPFMDGLELCKILKKEFSWMEIIILSGHERFEYAQEAIKLGVAEYLSKPISGDALLKEVNAIADRIAEKRREREIREKYYKEIEEKYSIEKRDLFQHIVTGDKSVSELLELAEHLDVDLSAMWYVMVLLKVESTTHKQEEYSNSLVEIEKQLTELEESRGLLAFERNLEGRAYLFMSDSREELLEKQNAFLKDALNLLRGGPQLRYFGGIGTIVNRLTEIPDSFAKASHAFAHRYLNPNSAILDFQNLNDGEDLKKDNFKLSNVDPKQIDRNKIKEFLRLGEREEVLYFTEEFFNNLGSNAFGSTMFRQYLIMDIYFCVTEFIEGLSFSREEIEVPDITSGLILDTEKTEKYIVRILEKGIYLREQAASNRYGDVVNEVLRYVEENYGDEELSLNQLASHVNFSPNHLSMIFSQQMGMTFVKYLTEYRMNKAKELLKCSGKKSSEISMAVGYKDPHYFSYLFKKTQGMTPTQFRGGKNAEDEDER